MEHARVRAEIRLAGLRCAAHVLPDENKLRGKHGSQVSPYPSIRRRPQGAQKGVGEVSRHDRPSRDQSEQRRRVGEVLIREADNLACQSWNENVERRRWITAAFAIAVMRVVLAGAVIGGR
jgi:hypothetical protein